MNENNRKRSLIISFVFGMLGCLCYGSGDWLMVYGDTSYSGSLFWLTDGVAAISPWRNSLAMLLSFPGIIFYGIGLFAAGKFITDKKSAKIYQTLNIYGLTPVDVPPPVLHNDNVPLFMDDEQRLFRSSSPRLRGTLFTFIVDKNAQ